MKKDATRERVMAALLACITEKDAAEMAGVSARTVRNYLADAEFYEEFIEKCRNLVQTTTTTLQRSMIAAAATLDIIMRNSPKLDDKMRAAKYILDYGVRYTELTDLYARLDEALIALGDTE